MKFFPSVKYHDSVKQDFMLASFIVRLVITDGGSIRHGLMQCSIAFSIATQGRRTQGARGEGIPPLDFGRSVNPWTWLTLSMLEIRGLQHAQLTQYQSEAGQISLLPPIFQIFLGPCQTFILKARYQQTDPQIFIFEFFYIILRVSEGKKCAILQSWNEFTCSTNLSYNQLGLFLSQTSRLAVRKIFPQGNSRYYGIFVTSPK